MSKETPSTLKVACIQMPWAESIERNLARTLDYVEWAAEDDCRVVLFPEASITSYYFPYLTELKKSAVADALDQVCSVARDCGIWTIVGTVQKRGARYDNLAHVISPKGDITYEHAKVNMAGVDEKKYCRGGNNLALFEIDGVLCTMVICRDGRHPELYRIPAMAGARILFHPSCSSDEVDAVCWKREAGRAQQPVAPNSGIFHCVANTVGQSPDGKQTSSGWSYIREPRGIPLAEAGYYQDEMITAVLDLSSASRAYVKDSMRNPPFMRKYWREMVRDVKERNKRR